MTRVRLWTMVGLLVAFVGVVPRPVTATYGVDQFRFRIYMLPPVGALGTNACLRQGFHSIYSEYMKALDWATNCNTASTEIVRFRYLGVDLDNNGGGSTIPQGEGVTQQLANENCPGGGHVHVGLVTIYSLYGTSIAGMKYVHTVMYGSTTGDGTTTFAINARGTTLSGGYLGSIGVGDTVSDASAASCWSGWHVHENNTGNDAFDLWNDALYKKPGAQTGDHYLNNSSANWIRRLTWTLTPGE
jgi:hypothetical protein